MHGLQLNRVCCLLNFSCSACVREEAGPLKSSRKYEPLTQGNGLNPNHDGSSTEGDVPNEFCVLRNKPLSRERKQPTFFCPFTRVNMAEEELSGDDAPRAVLSNARHGGWYEPEGRTIRHHIIYNGLRVAPEEYPVLRMTRIMFETFNVPVELWFA